MEKIRADDGLRFTRPKSKGCFGNSYSGSSFVTGINPNKAVFTIDSKTSNILIVNKNACELLGAKSSEELCDVKFSNLLTCKNKVHVSALAEHQFNSQDGTMILLSGKVVEMIHKNGQTIPVSLWIRQIDGHESRCLALAEPVERRVAQVVVDSIGNIINGDNETLMLFQLDSHEKLVGMNVTLLIPAIMLPNEPTEIIPKHVRKQRATGKTQEGVSFPLCLMVANDERNACENSSSNRQYIVTIWVFSNMSGLVVIDENSLITSTNHHFSNLMFGYSQSRIIGQNIFKLIPNFGQEFEFIDTRSQITSSMEENEESETETDHFLSDSFAFDSSRHSNKDPFKICLDFNSPIQNGIRTPYTDIVNDTKVTNHEDDHELLTPVNETANLQLSESSIIDESISNKTQTFSSYDSQASPKIAKASTNECLKTISTSTPDIKKRSSIILTQSGVQQFNYKYVDGKYKGEAVHADGNSIEIVYTVNKHTLSPSNNTIYLVWICRDPDEYREHEDPDEEKQLNLTLTLNSITSTIENSIGGATMKNTAASSSACASSMATAGTLANITSSRPNSFSVVSQCEDEQISGDYCLNYTTLKQIGKGAYGYVKMAYRNSDRLLVISKFILKEKLCSNFMITTEDKKEIPMEIYLLMRVKHPNIVNVLDVYENEKFYQLIMEKHGSGMDLFEFIDRRPLMSEQLGCFIFRQIAKAVDFLHSLNILHRDIKDENIILDHHFHIKLIDFGSATFMEPGKMFSTFYGTTEYCSPEVLAGNKYYGPELEVWSLGVTLFVLMFFENPFLDLEDTLRAELMMPQDVSAELESLFKKMLDKDPKTRITMKDLLAHEWIVQEIKNEFDFATIVPCDDHEAHPDVYAPEIFSSATALSTSHDSLSLADDSICDDNDDENFEVDPTNSNSYIQASSTFNEAVSDDLQHASSHSTIRSKLGKISNKICTWNDESTAHAKLDIHLAGPCEINRTVATMNIFIENKSLPLPNLLSLTTISMPSQVTASPLTTSKSENNIFDKNNLIVPFALSEVVSMSDLISNDINCEHHAMNDLSRTKVLNTLSSDEIRVDGKLLQDGKTGPLNYSLDY